MIFACHENKKNKNNIIKKNSFFSKTKEARKIKPMPIVGKYFKEYYMLFSDFHTTAAPFIVLLFALTRKSDTMTGAALW